MHVAGEEKKRGQSQTNDKAGDQAPTLAYFKHGGTRQRKAGANLYHFYPENGLRGSRRPPGDGAFVGFRQIAFAL